jgi:hypothetical protein
MRLLMFHILPTLTLIVQSKLLVWRSTKEVTLEKVDIVTHLKVQAKMIEKR